jgi:hypothetical protein
MTRPGDDDDDEGPNPNRVSQPFWGCAEDKGRFLSRQRPIGSNGHFETFFKKTCVTLSHSSRLSNGRSVSSQKAELTKRPLIKGRPIFTAVTTYSLTPHSIQVPVLVITFL